MTENMLITITHKV